MRCSSRSIVIFLIVSKEIQKYDQRKFYFFSEKKNFQIWYSRSSLKKKNSKKNFFAIFFPYTKIAKQKAKFHKIHYFANIKYKRNSRKYCENNLRRNIFVKRKIFTKKNSIIKIFNKKKNLYQKIFVKKIFRTKKFETNFRKKNFSRKKISKKSLKIILAIFLYLKKISVEIR